MKNFSRSQKRLNQGTENQGVRPPFLNLDSIVEQQTTNVSKEEAIKISRLLHFFSNNRIIPVKKKQEKPVDVQEA